MNKVNLFLAVGVLACAGCNTSDPYGREAMEGTVTVKGEPISNASIGFTGEKGRTDFDTGSLITDGRFEIKREFGLPPGKYRVRISKSEGVDPDKTPPPKQLANGVLEYFKPKELVPVPYSTEGVIVEVVAGQNNVFNFDIP